MSSSHKNQTMLRTADTGKSVHLSASAGSGKTRALKDRYLALVDLLDKRGLHIDQAVAITFTDKAAAEIKGRVIRDLPEAVLKETIRGRQDLRISTIHSFCMNLLKRYPLEAGLPPDFGVLDARDQAYKVNKAIEDALEESDRDPQILSPLVDFTANDLIATIGFLLSIRSKLKRMEIDAGGPEGLIRAVHSGMGTERNEAELKALIENPMWRALFMQMELFLRTQGGFYDECCGPGHGSLADAKDARDAYRIAESLAPVYFTQKGEPRKKLPISGAKFRGHQTLRYTGYEALHAQAEDTLSRFLTAYRHAQAGHEAASLLRLFHRAEEKYQESKLREGLLDFDDLEIYAYRLLQGQESPDILYWLDRKILHFLVDEFQDTSDIQWAILNKLTEEIFAGQGADKPVRPTLFVVGDEKQSIYRFREANYRLIEDVRQTMEKNIPAESREILTLDKNFRSTPEVIETVNRVFAALWRESYKPSEVERTGHRGSVRLIELVTETSDEQPAGPTEAEILAREVWYLIQSGTTIYEKPLDSLRSLPRQGSGWIERKAGYGDCAVLIQSRTKLKEYEAALKKEGVPFRVVGGIGFYEEDEIQALINILFFLWNRDDSLALATALKSPLFGLSDSDLLDVIRNDGSVVDALRKRRPDDWNLLHDWMNIAGLVPLAVLIHRITEDTGAYVRFGRRNPQAIFNIDKLLDTAREFDRRGYTTLQDFVEWVKNVREAEQREAAADMNLPGFQGAVSIMTVHKAKGLEFPVVFLPGMNQQPKSITSGPLVIVESDGGVRMAVKRDMNPLYSEMWDREREELRREHQRLMYVAMTRTRDHLVMIGMLNGGKTQVRPNTWLHYLHAAAPMPLFDSEVKSKAGMTIYAHPARVPLQADGGAISALEKVPSTPRQKSTPVKVDIHAVLDNLSPVPPFKTREWKKATDFIEQGKETTQGLQSFPAAEGTVSPLTRGSVLHRCLEVYAKQGSYDLERVIGEHPDILSLEREAILQFMSDVGSVLHAVLADSELTWIFDRTGNAFAELPFLYRRGDSLVSGVIDRLVITDNTGHVIDYKAILVENEKSLADWKDHYRPQLQVYCEAVKDIFRLRSVEGSLLFLDSVRLELTTKV